MKKVFYILIILTFCIFLYAMYIEPNTLKVNEYTIYNQNLPEGFEGYKIVHLSDFLLNNKSNYDLIEKAINNVNDENADVIVFTGDLLKSKLNDKNVKKIIELLTKIEVNYKKFAILGDNDLSQSKDILEQSGFTILDNTSELIFNNDNNPITITGGDYITNELVNNTYDKKFNIVLLHKPDDFDNINIDGYSLVLAGHSLGGQIRVPFYGPILKQKGAKKYINTQYQEENKELYVSFGIGYNKYNIRLLNKPSINVYRLFTK